MKFRSLATRLIALWVLASIGLVAVAIAAVSTFALSAFALSANQSLDAVARQAPAVVERAVARHRSLGAAADDIVRELVQPGVGVVLVPEGGAPTIASVDGLVTHIEHPPFRDHDRDHDRAGHPPPPFDAARHRYERAPPLPFAMNALLHIDTRHVAVPHGRLAIFADPRPIAHTIDAFWSAIVPIGLAMIVASWFLGRYLSSLALRPLVETTAALNRFREGDFTPRTVTGAASRNEFGDLVAAYNGAAAQVNAAFEERRTTELQMRQFIGDAGHELRTPLTVIMGFIDVLRRRANSDAATTKIYETMLTESRRMRALIDKLIVLARLENVQFAPAPAPVDLGDLAARVVATLQPLQPTPRIVLRTTPGAIANVQESEMYDAVLNLVENALKYAPLSIVEVLVSEQGSDIRVEVRDDGPGLSEEDRAHVFDRFYRGAQRSEKEGFGLGLAIVKRTVERAGGTVTVDSDLGRGARFVLHVPRADRALAASA